MVVPPKGAGDVSLTDIQTELPASTGEYLHQKVRSSAGGTIDSTTVRDDTPTDPVKTTVPGSAEEATVTEVLADIAPPGTETDGATLTTDGSPLTS